MNIRDEFDAIRKAMSLANPLRYEAPSHLEMVENIDAMTAEEALRIALRESMRLNGDKFEITRGGEIQPQHPTSEKTPKGLTRIATDGERNGRLAWVPGI